MAYKVTIDSQDIPKQLLALSRFEARTEDKIKKVLRSNVRQMKAEIVAAMPSDTGTARSSITTKIRGEGISMTGGVGSYKAEAWYTNVIEYGRGNGRRRNKKQPPLDEKFLSWVQRHANVAPEQLEQVAFLIARKIGRDGIPAVKMFEAAKNKYLPQVERELLAIINQAVRELAQ
jgi:hypothetical protein